MNIRIRPSVLSGEIDAPSSKSYAHRYLIVAAFSDSPCTISAIDLCDDVTATLNILKELGTGIQVSARNIHITPCNRDTLRELARTQQPLHFDVKESASTYRFFLVINAILGLNSFFHLGTSLKPRPVETFLKILRRNGFLVETKEEYTHIQGMLYPKEYLLDDPISSQFITGFLLGMGISQEFSWRLRPFSLSTPLLSKSYPEMTIDVLKSFHVVMEKEEDVFYKVAGSSLMTQQSVYPLEGDWSNSAFFLLAAYLQKSGIKLNGLNKSSLQGDRIIWDLLKDCFRADTSDNDFCFSAPLSNLSAIDMDIGQTPDLLPFLSVLAVFCEKRSRFFNIDRLQYKESNRIKSVCSVLSAIDVRTETQDNTLFIFPPANKNGLFFKTDSLSCFHDHRIVMMISLLSCVIGSEIVITDAEAVCKSYPNFFKDLSKLGCDIRIGE